MGITKNRMAKGVLALTMVLSALIFHGRVGAVSSAQGAAGVQAGSGLPANLNIHYTGQYCEQCHEPTPVEGGPAFLKYGGDYQQLCGSCHDNARGSYLHPVDIVPSDEKKRKIPGGMPLAEGKVTCATCHDLYLQCRESPQPLSSIRGAPYPKRTDFCFQCHAEQNYVMLNPHQQLDSSGVILEDKCLYCHAKRPDEKKPSLRFRELHLIGTVNDVCHKCHVISGNHSGNYVHFVKPKEKTLAFMKASEEKYGIILPLDEEGKITCVTCHNPHQRGAFPEDRPSAKGADAKLRHRLEGKMCNACHDM